MNQQSQSDSRISGHRLIALVGPFQSGKTTLLEALLARSGALSRQGNVRDGTTIGDTSAEARAHAMSVEANIATTDYLGDRFTFIDCPGSVEFASSMHSVLPVCDAAIVVCEADSKKLPALQLILHELEQLNIPRFLFLNKINQNTMRIRDALAMLQPTSNTPLLLRQIPIWENGIATGFIDLALERTFVYREHAASKIVDLPSGEVDREKEARYSMLELLADYDDNLMEELLSDIDPPRDQVFDDLAQDLRAGVLVPVLIGSADHGNGVTRLLKALRHETPDIAGTRDRLAISADGPPLAYALRIIHTAHGGKMTLARSLRGSFSENQTVSNGTAEERISGISRMMGASASKQEKLDAGDTAALGRLDSFAAGDTITSGNNGTAAETLPKPDIPLPVHALAIAIKDRKDEVRLSTAIAKLVDEDASLGFSHDQESGEIKISGQGEMHLRVALERLSARFGVQATTLPPQIAYRETITRKISVHGRHKKQSGGHGQFGDVRLDIAPRPRGEGFAFNETVHGGTVPKQYFSSVEAGCRDALHYGPLGFPVVDVASTLTDGSYHSVDSSDMAFRIAAKTGMSEALAKAGPLLLEPIMAVDITLPSDALSRATAIVSSRRGQILGFDSRPGWDGWDVVQTQMPQAELDGFIIELRSATAGVGSFSAQFDHYAELSGKAASAVVTKYGSGSIA